MEYGRAAVQGKAFGRYRLIELLGRGGMGEVWRAHDTVIDRVVALKLLPSDLADDATFQERFRREARAAAGLDEPHVVPVFDVGEIESRLYVTMRLINGRDVQRMLVDGPLEPGRAVSIVAQIASALHAAHRINLVHRDVKPSNILVAEDDFAYLIDFGIARGIGEAGLTNTGSVIGTWAYLAPERLSQGQIDPRSDIYALTCVLHECLTGSQPFPSNSLEQQIAAHLSQPPPRPSELRRNLPAAFDAVIARGMAKDPNHRFSSTRELAEAARRALTARTPTAPPPYRPPTPPAPAAVPHRPPTPQGAAFTAPPPKPKRSWNAKAVAAASAAVIAAIVGVTAVLLLPDDDHKNTASPTSSSRRSSPSARAVAPSTAAAPSIETVLLTTTEVNTILGTSDVDGAPPGSVMSESSTKYSPSDCRGVVSTGLPAVFGNSGYTQYRERSLKNSNRVLATEDIYQYPSAAAATSFINSLDGFYESCRGKSTTQTYSNGATQVITIPDINTGGNTLFARLSFDKNRDYGCQHFVRTASVFIIETMACMENPTDQARSMAAQIAAKAGGR